MTDETATTHEPQRSPSTAENATQGAAMPSASLGVNSGEETSSVVATPQPPHEPQPVTPPATPPESLPPSVPAAAATESVATPAPAIASKNHEAAFDVKADSQNVSADHQQTVVTKVPEADTTTASMVPTISEHRASQSEVTAATLSSETPPGVTAQGAESSPRDIMSGPEAVPPLDRPATSQISQETAAPEEPTADVSEPLAAAATSGPAEVPQEPTATHGAAEAAADSMEVSVRSEFTQKVPEQPAPVQDEPAEPSTAVAATPPESPAKPKRTRKKAATSEPVTAAVAEAPAAAPSAPVPVEEPPPENKKKWYAIKVQSGREDTIKAAILRKVAIEGLEQYVGQIVIPVEEVVEKKMVRIKDKKTGEYTTQERKVTKKKKKFHGYIFAELEFNDRILYLFRETSGVGDFLNMRGKPPVPEPMPEHEVQSMLTGITVKDPLKRAKFKLDFEKGDRVRIREGSFINNEGEVKEISEVKDPTDTPKVKVELTFWGRPLEVELDASQVEKI